MVFLTEKKAPELTLAVTFTGPTKPDRTGSDQLTMALLEPGSAKTVMLFGQTMVATVD